MPGLCEGLVGSLWEISVGLSEVSVWGHFLSVGGLCVGLGGVYVWGPAGACKPVLGRTE